MSERNLKSRKSSQSRKISIVRVLRLMTLLKKGKINNNLVQAFADDLVKQNPKIVKNNDFKAFEMVFGLNPRGAKNKQETLSECPYSEVPDELKKDLSEDEMRELAKNVRSLFPSLEKETPKGGFKTQTPPPVPTLDKVEDDISKKMGELLARAESAEAGIDQVSQIALEFKAEAMVERQENKLILETLAKLLPNKVEEAINITVERIDKGRDLRMRQVLHALRKDTEKEVQNH